MAVSKMHLMNGQGQYGSWNRGVPDDENSTHRRNQLYNVLSMLEEEIRFLRNRMEQTILLEKSLTSENVIKISSLLDEKINEYLHHKKKG